MPKNKNKLVDELYDRALVNDDEEIILSDGFEEALIGVSAGMEKIAIYDFWKALDLLLKQNEHLTFDEALVWMEDFSKEKIDNLETLTPLFVKTL
tara:strand:+ start:5149 stop:5433 length:285 start_codon:yes stop_codon:yes gene_type:complete